MSALPSQRDRRAAGLLCIGEHGRRPPCRHPDPSRSPSPPPQLGEELGRRRGWGTGLVRREGAPPRRRRGADPGSAGPWAGTTSAGPGPGAVGRAVPGPRDGRRVVPPLGRRAPHRGTQLGFGPGGDPNGDIAAWFEGYGPLNAGPFETTAVRANSSSTTRPQAARSRELHHTGPLHQQA